MGNRSIGRDGGKAHLIRVAEHIWNHHEDELRQSGDLFFTWQYDMRWAAQRLRDQGILEPSSEGIREWRLVRTPHAGEQR